MESDASDSKATTDHNTKERLTDTSRNLIFIGIRHVQTAIAGRLVLKESYCRE